MAADHTAVIRAAAVAAGVEPVRARAVPDSGPLPRYVVVTRTPAGRTNLAAIDPDFVPALRDFELVDGDLDAALERRARDETDAIERSAHAERFKRCPHHPLNRVSDCEPCEALAARNDETSRTVRDEPS